MKLFLKLLAIIFIIIILINICYFCHIKFNKEVLSVTILPTATILPATTILPKIILPGDPIFITVNSTSSVSGITFDNKIIPFFNYNSKPTAIIGIDLNEKKLEHFLKIKFENGQEITEPITLTQREKIEIPLGIPEKLGGNTSKAEKQLLSNLSSENVILNNVKSATTTLWKKSFIKPLASLLVTDAYGYDRVTVNSLIAHKGTDFHAQVGTEVQAMNDGTVKVAKNFIVYGNTVIIDHGLGLQTLYMHLSKINVKVGDKVTAGQVIGLSGKTGYAEAPHLHVSIKINGISIDPMVFLSFF